MESRLHTAAVTRLYVCTMIPSGQLYRAQCQSGLRLLINVELNLVEQQDFLALAAELKEQLKMKGTLIYIPVWIYNCACRGKLLP